MASSEPQPARRPEGPPGRDRVAGVAGLAAVAAFVVGQYVAPALVWPEEQVGGVQLSFYANDRGRLLAQAVLLGVAAALFLRFLLEEAVGNAALFPFAVFLAAAALGRAGVLPRWLQLAGAALAVLVGLLAVGATAGLDLGAAAQPVFLASSAWVAALAFATGWPLPSAAGRRAEPVR